MKAGDIIFKVFHLLKPDFDELLAWVFGLFQKKTKTLLKQYRFRKKNENFQ